MAETASAAAPTAAGAVAAPAAAVAGTGAPKTAQPKSQGKFTSAKPAEDKAAEAESGPNNMKAGTRIFARWRDGTERRAVVIERKVATVDGVETGQFTYYVHYLDFNRRMDTWLPADAVRYDADGDAQAKVENKARADKARAAAAAAAAAAASTSSAGAAGGGAGDADGGGMGGKSAPPGALGGKSAPPAASMAVSRELAAARGGAGEEEEEEIVEDDGTRLRVHRKADGEAIVEFVEPEHEGDGLTQEALREHDEVTKIKNVNYIEIGRYRMETWYFSPLPKEYWPDGVTECLYFCDFCLKFFRRKSELANHAAKCKWRHPPGDEIYRGADGVSMWEVDGVKDKIYCQNLSYIAKMFLDHKTLFYDVDLFLFYVMTEMDEYGHHVVGYFSKEKNSDLGYNLACILTMPSHQRKGYGRFLIQFSYELSKKEQKVGSPEKPLSDLGLLSYRSYWSWVLLGILRECKEGDELSILQLAALTSIKPDDIIGTLQHIGLIKYINGQHVIVAAPELIEERYQRLNSKPGPIVDPTRLHWAPLRQNVKKDKWLISAKMAAVPEQ